MKRLWFATSLVFLAWAATAAGESAAPAPKAEARSSEKNRQVYFEADANLLVPDRDEAMTAILKLVKHHGGYFLGMGANHLALKVPAPVFEKVVAELATTGEVVAKSLATQPLDKQLIELKSSLASRRKMLGEYLAVMKSTSDRVSLLQAEAATTALLEEIEQTEGSLRFATHRSQYGDLRVQFDLKERGTVHPSGPSNFAWLNTVGIDRVLNINGGIDHDPEAPVYVH